jgi:hypothetical protein
VIVLVAVFASGKRNLAVWGWVPPFFGALSAHGFSVRKFEACDELTLAARFALVVVCTVDDLVCVVDYGKENICLPFIITPGAGAVAPDVVQQVNALASSAHCVALLAAVLRDVTEKTLLVAWLQRMLRYP